MLVGILSDSHDREMLLETAVQTLRQRGAQMLLHCGDLCSAPMLRQFIGIPTAFVWGNCDFDRMNLERYGQQLGLRCLGPFGQIELDGKLIGLMHGDDAKLRDRVLREQQLDYLLVGHSHVRGEQQHGRIRIINPGALHRVTEKTVALLDTAGSLEFIVIE
jgi:uncharacterized protein